MLVLGLLAGLIAGAPFWGSRMLPLPVRIWIALLLAMATFPLVKNVVLPGGITLLSHLGLVGGGVSGLALGWVAQLLFAGMRLAGQAIETKSGLGFVQLVDLLDQGSSTGIFSAFLEVLAGLVFFALNGHHLLIQALMASYNIFPLAGEKFAGRVRPGLISSWCKSLPSACASARRW